MSRGVGLCFLQGPVPNPNCHSPSRLTAFVLKVLSSAQEQVGDSPEKLQETARWLLSQQQTDGSFRDPCPVIHRGMQVWGQEAGPSAGGHSAGPFPFLADIVLSPCTNQGGLVGNDETVALTAFVVIALHHGLAVFQDENTEQLRQAVVRAPTCLPCADPSSPHCASGPQGSGHRLPSPLSSRKLPSQMQTHFWG